jgi:VIT1/CCC1 family predicted Fe2+/Mn2+ transporter
MVLTFTLGARLIYPEESTDGLLIAALGCNIAWGIIDAFLYLLGCMFERRRVASLLTRLAAESDGERALRMVQGELSSDLLDLGDPAQRDRFYASIAAVAHQAPSQPLRLTTEDMRGAVVIFFLVALTALPAALPFFLIPEPLLALRTSNVILVSLLFLVGYRWGGHVGAPPWLAGILIMSLGIVMVLVAIPLGG